LFLSLFLDCIMGKLSTCVWKRLLMIYKNLFTAKNVYVTVFLQVRRTNMFCFRSWGSSVRIVSDYGLDDWGLIPDRGRGFFL
jgi:hypothetical protein